MKKAIVFGAGLSGNSAVKLLENRNYKVLLVDDKIGMKGEEALNHLEEVQLMIKSPGIPPENFLVRAAVEKGVEILDEIELGYRELKIKFPNSKVIAITGTNGKTTTTSKIAELLNFSGRRAIACGNIGKPFGEAVLESEVLDYAVVECSSFQLENIKDFKADIAMIINLAPDHTDRYSTIEEYYEAKFNICKNQTKNDKFILNLKDNESLKRMYRISGDILGISTDFSQEKADVYVKNGIIFHGETEVISTDRLSLKGKHNLENMLFLIAVGVIEGIDKNILVNYLENASPIEHRLETFFKTGKTLFINDSKGTNIESTRFAVEAYPNSILVCGGKDKKLDLTPLAEIILKNVKEVYLIGENREQIIFKLNELGYPTEKIHDCGTLEEVVGNLKKNINLNEENIVLFSPATSSFDQFKNFEERGKIFKMNIIQNFSEN